MSFAGDSTQFTQTQREGLGDYGHNMLLQATDNSESYEKAIAEESKHLLTSPETTNSAVRCFQRTAEEAVQNKRSAFAAGKRKTDSIHNSYRIRKRGTEGENTLPEDNGDGMDEHGNPVQYTYNNPDDTWGIGSMPVSEGSLSKLLEFPELWDESGKMNGSTNRRMSDREPSTSESATRKQENNPPTSPNKGSNKSLTFPVPLGDSNRTLDIAERMGDVYNMANETGHDSDMGTLHRVLADSDRNLDIDPYLMMDAYNSVPSLPSGFSQLSQDSVTVKKEGRRFNLTRGASGNLFPSGMTGTKIATYASQMTSKGLQGATNVSKGLHGAVKKVGTEVKTNLNMSFKIEDQLSGRTGVPNLNVTKHFNKLSSKVGGFGTAIRKDKPKQRTSSNQQTHETGTSRPAYATLQKVNSMDVLQGVLESENARPTISTQNVGDSLNDFSSMVAGLNDPSFMEPSETSLHGNDDIMPPPEQLFMSHTDHHMGTDVDTFGDFGRTFPASNGMEFEPTRTTVKTESGETNEMYDDDDDDEEKDKDRLRNQWTPEEDKLLQAAVQQFGTKAWREVAARVPNRTNIQCRARYKRCLRPGLVKGYWKKEEDAALVALVEKSMAANDGVIEWRDLDSKIQGRSIKQCRERWTKNLDPNLKKGQWSESEDSLILEQQKLLGNKWAQIARMLPGRTEHSVKTRHRSLTKLRQREWTSDHDQKLLALHREFGTQWNVIVRHFAGRSKNAVTSRFKYLMSQTRDKKT